MHKRPDVRDRLGRRHISHAETIVEDDRSDRLWGRDTGYGRVDWLWGLSEKDDRSRAASLGRGGVSNGDGSAHLSVGFGWVFEGARSRRHVRYRFWSATAGPTSTFRDVKSYRALIHCSPPEA